MQNEKNKKIEPTIVGGSDETPPDENLPPPPFDIVTEGFSESGLEKKEVVEIIQEIIIKED